MASAEVRSERPRWLAEVVIRHAKSHDLREIEWEGEYRRFRRVYQEVFERTIKGQALMWLAELPDGVLAGQGFVQLKMNDRSCADGKQRAYLHSFRVRLEYRNSGLGTTIMDHIESDLVQRGYRELTLNVAEENEGALRLYRRRGFEVVKRISGEWSFYDDRGLLRSVSEPGFRLMKTLELPDG
jgi:ribosomal protein S18 acetylase RimI-like enzyme